jgi:hypothetical protein
LCEPPLRYSNHCRVREDRVFVERNKTVAVTTHLTKKSHALLFAYFLGCKSVHSFRTLACAAA